MFDVIKRFFDFCGEENKKQFKGSIVLGVIDALFNAFKIPAIMYILMGLLSDDFKKNKFLDSKHLTGACIILGISLVACVLIRMKSTMMQTRGGYNAASFKRIDIAQKLRYLPMGYFNEQSVGNITSVATNTMEQLGNLGTRVVMMTFKGVLESAIIILLIFIFNWKIGLIALVGASIFMFLHYIKQGAGIKDSAKKLKADTALVGQIMEYIQGISEVKSYNLYGKESEKLNKANQDVANTSIKLEFKYLPYILGGNLILRITSCIIVLAAISLYFDGEMSLLYAIGMTIMAFSAFAGLESVGIFSSLLQAMDMCVAKGNAILNLENMDIDGKEEAVKNCDIELKDVTFSYDKKKVIDGISLKIPAKSTLAIVGPSGGGKTTLTRLIARFWDVDSGEVTIGGENIKAYSMDSLMNNFSFVFQNVYLFNDTIENNIKFSNPNATHEEVVAAAKKACCDKFIESLPEGYDTVIGEGGASISGGEKQRLSIARAIMKDSPIIILDEATANVDPENEKELTKAIESLTKDKTIIMIAHRLKTVRHADNIVVIDNGKIAEQGTHEELMKNNGIYKKFIDSRELAVSWKL